MTKPGQDPILLTPGPLTTTAATKQAMLHDWGSRDPAFLEINDRVRRRLLDVAGAADSHVCVPLQGSGTFAVEATLGTLVGPASRCLVLVNGAYGHRMVKILTVLGRGVEFMEWPEDTPVDAGAVAKRLADNPAFTHVAVVHCETTSGILNPLAEIARVVAEAKRSLIVDAMSAFGALPLTAAEIPFDAVMASSNKCLEGVPGLGFAIIRKSVLQGCKGNAHSLALDLFDQWTAMEANRQWRFTPPTHVIAAFDEALSQYVAEGGQKGRLARYSANCRLLVQGMRELGFTTLLDDDLQAPIIITFHLPADPAFDFVRFYDALAGRGYVIYPGKLTVADSFRMGCIGALGREEMLGALDAVREAMVEMGVQSGAPKAA